MAEIERVLAPASLDEAAEALAAGEATLLAGGTDLMPASHAGKVRFAPMLINLRRIAELSGIAVEDGELRIGTLVTIAELLGDEAVRERCPILAEAADHFASPQIRNAATIGGNLCNASPAGDMLVPLLAAGARVELASKPDGTLVRRVLPLEEFLVGPGRTRRRPDELLATVRVPAAAPDAIWRFFKSGTRPALDISAVSIGLLARKAGNALHEVRIALGAVAPTVVRARAAEATLEGRVLNPETMEAAACAARDEVHPISDVRASAWYRKELIHNMLRRMLSDVAET